jgi:hypothetical protein
MIGITSAILQLLQDGGLALKYSFFVFVTPNLNALFISEESATCHICMSYGTPIYKQPSHANIHICYPGSVSHNGCDAH